MDYFFLYGFFDVHHIRYSVLWFPCFGYISHIHNGWFSFFFLFYCFLFPYNLQAADGAVSLSKAHSHSLHWKTTVLINITYTGNERKVGEFRKKNNFPEKPIATESFICNDSIRQSIRKIMPLWTYFMSQSLICHTSNLQYSINEPGEIGFHGSDD